MELISSNNSEMHGVTGLLGVGNFDGDRLTDEEEFVVGTDPTVADELVLSASRTNVFFMASAPVGPGYAGAQRKFRLEEKYPLGSPAPWQVPAGWVDVTGDNQVFSWPSPVSNNNYRLRVWLE